MKITNLQLEEKENKWLKFEILKSLTNEYWNKVDKSKKDLEITINVNGIELEPKFLIDLFNNIEKYVDREAKDILEDKFRDAKNKAWELTQMIDNVSANIISEFDVIMGYYTRFELEVVSGGDYETDYEEVVSEQADCNPFGDETKWYDFEKDMRKVSKENPNVLLKLFGEGEESGDLWVAYFKNGKMQMCKAEIVSKNFDEALLQ